MSPRQLRQVHNRGNEGGKIRFQDIDYRVVRGSINY